MLNIGELLGERYLIEEQIGSGGMSLVFRAKCTKIDRNVAIKVLKPEFASDEEFVKRFKVEAQSAGSLSHPNIVNIYDIGVQDNLYYIVMEYVQGCTLKDLIQKDKFFTPEKTIYYASQICAALVHAHEHHIIHCDIKPHNILVTQDGRVKVADFGIAKAVTAATICMPGNAIGSVHYFSPEQARGGVTDVKSDIYSLGIVMYEMITGEIPFEGDTPVAVALKHIEQEVLPPSTIIKDIPQGIEDIILKAIRKHPKERYHSAEEMYNDIQKAVETPNGKFVEKIDIGKSATMKLTKDDMKILKQSKSSPGNKESSTYSVEEKKEEYKETYIEEKKGSDFGLIAAALVTSFIIIGILSIGIFKYVLPLFKVGSSNIPNVVNMTLEEAKTKYKSFDFYVQEDQYNNEIEEGKIISQDPPEGENVEKVNKINVILSKGIELVRVPAVINLDIEDAKAKLLKQELDFNAESVYDDNYPQGTVIEQDPTENTKVPKGDVVKLVVSKGKKIEQTFVPNIKGKTEEEARAILDQNQLLLTVKGMQESEQYEKGQIISQFPTENEYVDIKTSIEVIISSGRSKVKVPNLIGENISKVEEILNSLGIQYQIILEPSNLYEANYVIKQNIEPNSLIEKDSVIILTVSDGKRVNLTKTLHFDLPQDREKVRVRILSYGSTSEQPVSLHDKVYETSKGSIEVSVSGTGKSKIVVYFDDVIVKDEYIEFD